ncbi:hypothetical protein [Alistipes sp. ZOR0009]|uniref:hypothetical protein n=1 Tax=Alistipes sp. ZOR0009 TaxID=1339253 RepID=UPI0012E07F75|nr:hypothetical protein [Alistipes sp. ZOR0009]
MVENISGKQPTNNTFLSDSWALSVYLAGMTTTAATSNRKVVRFSLMEIDIEEVKPLARLALRSRAGSTYNIEKRYKKDRRAS